MQTVPLVPANGVELPAIGLGTGPLNRVPDIPVIAGALRAGYRLIDTAALYRNEALVGDAVRASGVSRSEIMVSTKIWHDRLGEKEMPGAVEASLARLGLDRIDLLLVHWPNPALEMAEIMGGLARLVERGLAVNIGVSNFTRPLIEAAVAASPLPIVCNQIEIHPYLSPVTTIAACRRHGMAVVAHCPLGRAAPLEDKVILEVAARHGKTAAQAILRWHVQNGIVPIPSSHDPERLVANLEIFDFELDAGEMAAIDALGARNLRHCAAMVDGLVWD